MVMKCEGVKDEGVMDEGVKFEVAADAPVI